MSRGISWRQRWMLESIARHTKQTQLVRIDDKFVSKPVLEPVAWRSIDYGPTHSEAYDPFTSRGAWNHEQALRRALRSLERRGLVELGQYVFCAEPIISFGSTEIRWTCIDPDQHNPSRGDTRIMTGVLLTDAGWAVVHASDANRPTALE